MDDPDQLILRCRQDPAAFRRLFELFQERLYSFLVHLVGRQAAEDLFQEVWVRVYEAAPGYEPRGQASGWLFRIANNLAISHLRGASQERRRAAGEAGDDLPAREPDPAEQTERSEEARRVEAAIASLPQEQRQVFLLREEGGMAFKEIAESLEIPLGTALSRMNAALEKLRRQLGDVHA